MGLRETKRRALIQRIVETTCELIDEVGYEHASIEAVVERLQISKPTFYRYFASKADVLAEIQYQWTQDWVTQLASSAAETSKPLSEHLTELARMTARDLLASPALARTLYLHSPTTSHERIQELEERAGQQMTRLISRAQELGEIRADLSADLLALVLDSTSVGVCYAWASGDIESSDLEAALVAALEVCVHGMATS